MLVTLGLYARRWHRLLRRRLLDPRFHALAQAVGYFLAGLLSAATSLGNAPMPLTLGLLCAVSGWPAVLLWAGGTTGYMVLWGAAGVQGPVWLALGLCVSLLLKDRPITRQTPLLVPVLAGVITAASKSVTVKSLVWSAPSAPPMKGWMAGMRWDTSPMSVDALK